MTISEFFATDHDEIDAILAAVNFDAPVEALARLKEFDRRLERHIVWEEEVLFPAAARAEPGLGRGPIAVMKMEHVEIRDAKTPHWTGSINSPRTYGHFGQSGTLFWVDPDARLGLVALTDRDFGDWARAAWPELADAVLQHWS